jgi:hypothetical protein
VRGGSFSNTTPIELPSPVEAGLNPVLPPHGMNHGFWYIENHRFSDNLFHCSPAINRAEEPSPPKGGDYESIGEKGHPAWS